MRKSRQGLFHGAAAMSLFAMSSIASAADLPNDLAPLVSNGILSSLRLPTDKTDVKKTYVGETRLGEPCKAKLEIRYSEKYDTTDNAGQKEFYTLTIFLSVGEDESSNFQFSQYLNKNEVQDLEIQDREVKLKRETVSVSGGPELQFSQKEVTSLSLETDGLGSIDKLSISNRYPGLLTWRYNTSITCTHMKAI
jgi:hypothetical protein